MRGYAAIISARFRVLLQYRAAAIGGFITQAFFGLVAILCYTAFYDSSTARQPIRLGQIISYIWLGQALLGMLPWNSDPEVRAIVRSGAVAYELLRPIDTYNLWYCRAFAMRTAPTLLRAIPILLIAGCILPLLGLGDWGLQLPPSRASAGAFILAIAVGLLLSCAITMLLNLCLLWSVGGDGATIILCAAVTIFSGMVIPLPLFPDWFQAMVRWLPFASMVDAPYRLYTANYPPSDVWPLVVRQLAWLAALVLLGRHLLGRATRRLVVQGG